MKVLFDFSTFGVSKNIDCLTQIKNSILSSGAQLTNDLLMEYQKQTDGKLPQKVFGKISDSIRRSDCVIIEGSTISFSLGYILTESINLGKPVLILTTYDLEDRRTRFLSSIRSELLIVRQYKTAKELSEIVNDFLSKNPDIKTRFNLVIPNKLNSYITSKSKDQNCSKTEYILQLIRNDMKKSETYD